MVRLTEFRHRAGYIAGHAALPVNKVDKET